MEKRSADIFRLVGFVVLVVSAAAAMAFIEFVDASDDVSSILRKLAPGVPLAILFGYLTREASRHRENELWARKIATRLESVRPFLDHLRSDEARDAVLLQVGSAAYERDPNPSSPDGPAQDQTTIGQVQSLIAQIQALAGTGLPMGPPPPPPKG